MILVTGGTGLVGGHLLYKLAKNGYKVRATYRSKKKIDAAKMKMNRNLNLAILTSLNRIKFSNGYNYYFKNKKTPSHERRGLHFRT